MYVDVDSLVTQLLVSSTELDSLIQQAKSRDAALYLQGGRDTMLTLAKTLKQSSPLAVNLFNTPVTVTEEKK